MIIYKSPETPEEFAEYFLFRWQMLRKPLNLPRGSEQDSIEDKSFHIAAYDDQTIVAVGRIHIESNQTARIRYMAVHNDYHNQGIGSRILRELEEIANANNINTCWLYSREDAINFYLKNGYVIKGESDSELAIKHERMEKFLVKR